MDVVDKSGANRANAEAQRNDGNKPAGTHPLAAHITWNLENNVGNVEDGQEAVVVVALELEVLLQACQARIAANQSDGALID